MTVTEGGVGISYAIRLNRSPAPGETVTITVSASVSNQVVLTPTSRQLSNTTYINGRNIVVTAVDDTLVEGVHGLVLTHVSSSNLAGSAFNNLVSNLPVTINDNDGVSGGNSAPISALDGAQAVGVEPPPVGNVAPPAAEETTEASASS